MKALLIFAFILLSPNCSHADQYSSSSFVGIVKSIRGSARMGEKELSANDRIYRDQIVETKEKSLAVFELMDRTEIKIGPNSKFRVDKWSFRNEHDRDTAISLLRGQIRAHVKSKTALGEQVEFNTPRVSLGIRGTEFLVNVMEELENEVTQVALIEGLIHLHGNDLMKDKFIYPGEEMDFINDQDGKRVVSKKFNLDDFKANDETLLAPLAMKVPLPAKDEIKKTDEKIATQHLKSWKETLKELNEIRIKD